MVTFNEAAEAIGWPEDWPSENGQYFNRCISCGQEFLGHKRRRVCKPCATRPTPREDD